MKRHHALVLVAIAFLADPAAGKSHSGRIEVEQYAGRTFLHRASCARNTQPGHMHCHAHMLVAASGAPVVGRAASVNLVPSGYGPADLRNAYRTTVTGKTTTIIAIIDAYGYPNAERDLATYRSQYGLPACTAASGCFTQINQRGGTTLPPTDTGWAQEQALDIQIAGATCPNCRILLIEADDDTIDNMVVAVRLAVARGAAAISNSYGGAEAGTRVYAPAYNHAGIAITASAGDTGYGPEFPASAPYTIAVGGTKLVRASGTARGWQETVWASSGGGCSALFWKPPWQNDALCTKRMMNDVAVVAAPATGVAVYGPIGTGTASGWMVFGGTSVGAPLIAGIFAAKGMPTLGARALWTYRSTLFDITSGTNGNCGGTYFCTAGPGYDGPSGNGAPKGQTAL